MVWTRAGNGIRIKSFPIATARYGLARSDLHTDGFWRMPKMTEHIDLCRDLCQLLNDNPHPPKVVSTAVEAMTLMRLHLNSLACFKGASFELVEFEE